MASKLAQQVREFHEVYGCAIADSPTVGTPELRMLRLDLITEEVSELAQALGGLSTDGPPLFPADILEIADALGDLAYVVFGAALAFGIDLDAVLDEIHRSNMSKLGEDGKPIYREDGKVLKGPNFSRPDLARVLDWPPLF